MPKQDDLKYVGYFYRPFMVPDLWKDNLEEGDDEPTVRKEITQVAAAGEICYAIFGSRNEVYSWGMGENYVLGNLEDDNEYKPHHVNPKMWKERKVHQIALGQQHVVSLIAAEGSDGTLPALNTAEFVLADGAEEPKEDDVVSKVSNRGKSTKSNKDDKVSAQ